MTLTVNANNQVTTPSFTYDADGNVTWDTTNALKYDAEGRMNPLSGVTYTYDGDGRRVQKSSGTNYWYGPGGNVFAETDSAGNWTNYIFFGGTRLARNVSGDIKYYITDHLHSTAMFVDKAGTTAAILDDNDMYPWGGVVPGVGKTTSNNTIKFTGKYRDTDTAANLDYFGARYYSNTIGRFMSPDWAIAPTAVPYAKFGDPQSLNLYSYTENGPINRIDGDGHWFDPDCTACSTGGSGYSVAGYAGSEIGLLVCPHYGECNSDLPAGLQQQSTVPQPASPCITCGAVVFQVRPNGPKWDPFGIFKKQTLESNLKEDRASRDAAANIALDPITNGNKPSYGFMIQIMDLEDKNIIVDAIALGYEIGDAAKAFGDIEKLVESGSVDALELFRDQNNAHIDDLLRQANQAMHPSQQ